MQIMVDRNGIMPERAHRDDAGLDLFAPMDFYLWPHGKFTVFTGVRIFLPRGYCGRIEPKSGLLKNKGIITAGLIDSGYTGPIGVTLVNLTEEKVEFHRGDKIAQLTIQKIELPELELVHEIPKTERGSAGFGSTGR